ncbi:MAG: hypothetical protein IJT91_09100 [Clostridia bacterium]|nr:hypothetical protein [Clostridia bacterium]
MSDKEYVKKIIDIVPDDKIGKVIEFLMNISDEKYDEEKFQLVSKHILEKYHKAFEELAK